MKLRPVAANFDVYTLIALVGRNISSNQSCWCVMNDKAFWSGKIKRKCKEIGLLSGLRELRIRGPLGPDQELNGAKSESFSTTRPHMA